MSGNIVGGLKTRDKNLATDPDFYRVIGKMGDLTITTKKKGFQVDNRTFWEKLVRKPKLASVAGRIGGAKSKRGVARGV